MEFRKAVETDIDDIMNIIKQAQAYFKEQGIDQWQNNYPNPETIRNDIANKHSYILLKDNNIVATAAVSFDGEKHIILFMKVNGLLIMNMQLFIG